MYNNAILDQCRMTNYQNLSLTRDLFPGKLAHKCQGDAQRFNDGHGIADRVYLRQAGAASARV